MITIKIDGVKEVERFMKRLGENAPREGRNMCREIAEKITRNAKAFAPIWRGTLRDSISTETINENTFGVSMAGYGPEVETGHPVFSETPLLWDWIAEKVTQNPTGMLNIMNALLERGAKPSPFIMPAYQIVEAEIPSIMERRITNAIMKS